MEPSRGTSRASLLPLLLLPFLFALSALGPGRAAATGVFQVRRNFPRHQGNGPGGEEHLAALRKHDGRRLLTAVDLPLGGNGIPTDTGLYFTQIGIGTPSKGYYVQVDTGSDILWVNCISCDSCPRKSGLGIDLTLYDPTASASSKTVTCGQEFCATATNGGVPPSCAANSPCQYSITYGDGSSTTGFFVADFLQYDQVSGDGQTNLANASVTFGCGAKIGGALGSSNVALDGILGFGQANSSMLSQLTSAGKVTKIFSHCLDTVNGGGIFAIGNVVQPKVKTTPLVPGMPHYNVVLKTIDVGGSTLQLPTNIFDIGGGSRGTIIDSGTTLAYLPEVVYKAVLSAVFSNHPDVTLKNVQDFLCFQYSGSVDNGFPEVTFHFDGDLPLVVYPHDYLFQNTEDVYCVGFQSGGVQSKDGKDMVLLGDLALSNKLVVYDLENQVIGWTNYNCSSSIKIKDDKTGSVYTVDAHDISHAWRFHKSLFSLLVTVLCSYLML
ncbi:aspartic proteinase-like protein 2 isoform X2 [Brachypodium distachyon]|uniref:Peptidase A1 domain-containing protein n=1 Tax=Brachypodium distachyon TaxID=15368 RepID=I1I9N8_BRADI|nr:aspartic proteinase-like protein 2 isoform X2 [Brachypodium distachyon]KQJ99477.1 hypothetical protein BRADI_3g43390v3 [Brachypodium distachyon]|eukprot:XP_003572524.1 aspartic proteinase-like protein 2 isoform X2 [Brachypodium distachyon]